MYSRAIILACVNALVVLGSPIPQWSVPQPSTDLAPPLDNSNSYDPNFGAANNAPFDNGQLQPEQQSNYAPSGEAFNNEQQTPYNGVQAPSTGAQAPGWQPYGEPQYNAPQRFESTPGDTTYNLDNDDPQSPDYESANNWVQQPARGPQAPDTAPYGAASVPSQDLEAPYYGTPVNGYDNNGYTDNGLNNYNYRSPNDILPGVNSDGTSPNSYGDAAPNDGANSYDDTQGQNGQNYPTASGDGFDDFDPRV